MQERETGKKRPRRNPLTPKQITLLNALADHDMTGETLRDVIGFGAAEFSDAACALWDRKLLRGTAAQGCCNDPCGSTCISANKPEKTWGLTSLGNIAHQFHHNNKETNI